MRFADLKRKVNIDSSGQLDFHLKKMDTLITTNEEAHYYLQSFQEERTWTPRIS